MAKGKGIGAYNAILAAIKARTGVSHKEAQQTYRAVSARLGKAPTLTDARKSAAIAQEAGRAGKQIAAKRARELREITAIMERARQPGRRNRDKAVITIPAPARRQGRDDGAGGGGGAGGGSTRRAATYADAEDYYEIDPPDEIGGDDGDYAPD